MARQPYLVVLGVAQDAGYPQAGCRKACCQRAWRDPKQRRRTVSCGVVDPETQQRWMLDCSPHFPDQLRALDELAPTPAAPGLEGILLTHAHIGHYAGLMHLGREVIGARNVPTFAMPRMARFLKSNGPWNQLVALRNIELNELSDGKTVELSRRIRVTPMVVPHRDEFSETVAFVVRGPQRAVLYLPDIDKWERWSTPIESVLRKVDVAYLDGTFFGDGELPGRDMAKIPHPFITESIQRFRTLPKAERAKVRFIHFNHTNPVLDPQSQASAVVAKAGLHIAKQGERVEL